jgi:glycine cleavage system transcriptional repressor
VSDLTGEVIAAGGNVGESQAAKLGKHFSLMMLVDVPENRVDALKGQLAKLKDLTATVCPAAADAEDGTTGPAHPSIGYRGQLTLEGADNPGIVHRVTKILSTNGLNIDKMETSAALAPEGGTVLFRVRGVAHAYEPLASGFNPTKIKQELSDLGDALNCDIQLEDVTRAGEEYQGSFYAG